MIQDVGYLMFCFIKKKKKRIFESDAIKKVVTLILGDLIGHVIVPSAEPVEQRQIHHFQVVCISHRVSLKQMSSSVGRTWY